MKAVKTVSPTGSYFITLPEGIHEDYDDKVSSFWMDGEPLLLQLSSYSRSEGAPLSASNRLSDCVSSNPGQWVFSAKKVLEDRSVDQASAKIVDGNGVAWMHTYFVWPTLTIYATISGPEVQVHEETNWAFEALRRIRTAVV